MSRSTLKLTLMSVAAAIGLTVAAAVPSQANADDHSPFTVPFPLTKIYDNAVTGPGADYVVFAGSGAADWCAAGPGGPVASDVAALHVQPDGPIPAPGTTDRFWLTTQVPVEVYEFAGGGVFDFLGTTCGGTLDPFATGTGVLWVRGTTGYDGDTAARVEMNGVRASLWAADGSRVQVRTFAHNVLELQDPLTPGETIVGGAPVDVSVDLWGGRG